MTSFRRDAAARTFVPANSAGSESAAADGRQRREFDRAEALPLKWPQTQKERFDIFDSWHDVAMQIVHRAKGSFRLLAVAKKVINWQRGSITLSNGDLAERAGDCSEKTITRDVLQAQALGIVVVDMGWRKHGTQIIRTRTIRPALPIDLPDGIKLPERVFDMDTSGLDRMGEIWGGDIDTSGPGDRDISGLITIETISSGGSDAA